MQDQSREVEDINVECSPKSFRNIQQDPEQLKLLFPASQTIKVREVLFHPTTFEGTDADMPPEENQEIYQDEDHVASQEDNKSVWVDNTTKLLLCLVQEFKPRVGKCIRLKTKRKMWAHIKQKMDDAGFNYSATQIENKYRSLERRFKDMKTNNSQSGRNRLTCPFEKELGEILSDNAAVNPVHLLNDEEVETLPAEESGQDSENSFLGYDRTPSSSSSATRKKSRNDSIAEQLKIFNEDRQKEDLENKKFREKIINAMEQRDARAAKKEQLIAEKNDILKAILSSVNK